MRITKTQVDFREAVRMQGSVVSGSYPAEIHHAVGREGKHNKIDIGHWWILPLTEDEHRALHASADWLLNDVSGYKMSRKEFEKWAYKQVLTRLRGEFTVPEEVVEAIFDYHR